MAHVFVLAALSFLFAGCNMFADLDEAHPYTSVVLPDLTDDRDTEDLSDADAVDMSTCPNGQATACEDDGAWPIPNETIDLGRFALLFAAAELVNSGGCTDPANLPGGPDVIRLSLEGTPNVGLGGVLLVQGAVSTEAAQSVVNSQNNATQCDAAVAIGCDGAFGVALEGQVALTDALRVSVIEVGAECNRDDTNGYTVAICSLAEAIQTQQCVGVVLTTSAIGSAVYDVDLEQLALVP